jgi:ribosomal protein S27E
MIEVTCPHCGLVLFFPDEAAGTEQACEHCGKAVRLPSGAVAGFPGNIRQPDAAVTSKGETPSVLRRGVEAGGADWDVRPLQPMLGHMKRPPTEELHLCAFFKWFFLIVGCVATIALIVSDVNWYIEVSRANNVDLPTLLKKVLLFVGTFFGGIVLYTVFSCLGRIVDSLYLISKNVESRK